MPIWIPEVEAPATLWPLDRALDLDTVPRERAPPVGQPVWRDSEGDMQLALPIARRERPERQHRRLLVGALGDEEEDLPGHNPQRAQPIRRVERRQPEDTLVELQ